MSDTDQKPAPSSPSKKADNNIPPTSKINETSKSKPNPNNQQLYLIIFGFVSSIVVGIFVFMFAFSTPKKEVQANEPIPYLWNNNFRNELNTFVSKPRHKDVFVVYGPFGVGKTRGLRSFTDSLKAKDHIIFTFDFKSLSSFSTIDDFVQYLHSAIRTSIKALDSQRTSSRYQDMKEVVKLVEALTSIEKPIKAASELICKDPLFQRIAQALFCITESIKTSPEISLYALFEAFDALQPLSPIVIINDICKLLYSTNETIRGTVGSFWRICESFSSDYRSLPIIIEISDQIHLFQHIAKETVYLYRVDEFDTENAKSLLISNNNNNKNNNNNNNKNNKIFSQSNFQFAIEKFGGHGRSFAQFYDRLQEGRSPQAVYRLMLKQQKDRVISAVALDAPKTEVGQRIAFLRLLLTSGKKMLPVQHDTRIATHFMREQIVSLWNATHCCLSDRLVEKAVNDVLNKLQK